MYITFADFFIDKPRHNNVLPLYCRLDVYVSDMWRRKNIANVLTLIAEANFFLKKCIETEFYKYQWGR